MGRSNRTCMRALSNSTIKGKVCMYEGLWHSSYRPILNDKLKDRYVLKNNKQRCSNKAPLQIIY